MCRLAGADPKIITTTADDRFLLTADKLRACLTPKSRLLILCTPSNPSGAVYSKEELEAVAEVRTLIRKPETLNPKSLTLNPNPKP